jgi:ribosomal protein S18 acetylase RimI-like enzyme
VGWSGETAERFFAVYQAAFRERPGYPGWTAAEWIADNDDDPDFRADWSVLATLPGMGDVGFVTAAAGWIVQVGVVPVARGRGLAAALIGVALGRMAAGGATEAWLNVNVDNPSAAGLYRRLGFAPAGRRARFERQ